MIDRIRLLDVDKRFGNISHYPFTWKYIEKVSCDLSSHLEVKTYNRALLITCNLLSAIDMTGIFPHNLVVKIYHLMKTCGSGKTLVAPDLSQWFSTWSRWTTGCSRGPQGVPQILDQTFLKIVAFNVQSIMWDQLCAIQFRLLVVHEVSAGQNGPLGIFLNMVQKGWKPLIYANMRWATSCEYWDIHCK